MEDLESELDNTDLEQLIETAQQIAKKLYKSKFQAGLGKAEILEQKKINDKR